MKKSLLIIILFISVFAYSQEGDTEWDDFFMPGIGYKVYTPKNFTDLGVYQGIMTEFVIYARAKGVNSHYTGPARIKIYGNLSITNSSNTNANDIFFANVGVNLSFEGKTNRKFLIPYFGLETGGLFQRNFSSLQFSPVTGIQILSTKHILWNLQFGYQYTTKLFDEYSGFIYSSTLNVLLWNK